MIQEQFVRHLIDAAYPGKKIKFLEAAQFQVPQAVGTLVSKSISNGLFVGTLAIVNNGAAYAGSLSLAINNSIASENIEKVVKETLPATEVKGLAFDALTPTYAGTDAAGTKLCNLVFIGYKVSFA
jgi:hypothetical protein